MGGDDDASDAERIRLGVDAAVAGDLRAGVLDGARRADADGPDAGRDGGAGLLAGAGFRSAAPAVRGGWAWAWRSLAALPWLVAAIVSGSLSSSQAEGVTAFAARAEPGLGTLGSLASLGGIWNSEAVPDSRTTLFAVVAAVVLLGVVAVGLPVVVRRPTAVPLLILAAVAVVVPTLMATGPGLAVVESTVRALPGLGVVRDAQKWVALAVPGYTLAAAAAVVTLRRWLPGFVTAAVCSLALVATLPDLAWGVGGKVVAVQYPPGWAAAAAVINADPRPVAVLPADSMRHFPWAGEAPVLDPLPRWVRADVLTTGDLTISGRLVPGEGGRARDSRSAAGGRGRSRRTRPRRRGLAGRRIRRRCHRHPDRRRPPRRVSSRVDAGRAPRLAGDAFCRVWRVCSSGGCDVGEPSSKARSHWGSRLRYPPSSAGRSMVIVDRPEPEEMAMSVPSVFEADLPTVEYEEAPSPDEAHRNLRKALEQGPIAMGAHGPEILSYELVRTTLRDPRFQVPRGLGLETQGITSGPLWHRASTSLLAMNGDDHTRLRRLVSKAFTPRSVTRLDDIIVDVINELIDPLAVEGTLRGRRRHRPALSRADHLRASRCAS